MGETKKCLRQLTKELTRHEYVGIGNSYGMHSFCDHRDGAYCHTRYLQEDAPLKLPPSFGAWLRPQAAVR